MRHMKPFTTTEILADGRRHLPAQFEGLDRTGLLHVLKHAEIRTCRIPAGQQRDRVWSACLALASGDSLEITASSTLLQGWDEIGTINLALKQAFVDHGALIELPGFAGFVIDRVSIVQWHGEGAIADAGLAFHASDGHSFSAVSIDLPGAFRITGPGDQESAAWQFPESQYVPTVL
nr:hypothetical protein SrhCFBP13529_01070 [Stenotrophomonas rhizophila]